MNPEQIIELCIGGAVLLGTGIAAVTLPKKVRICLLVPGIIGCLFVALGLLH